jgi:hypothetical protein
MPNYDLFNGDADGICALQQLRLHDPRKAELVTGLKRDINLLGQIEPQAGELITVLDISLDKNRAGLIKALECGAEVFYADHHFSGDIPVHPRLVALIDTTPTTCTSLIINHHLSGAHSGWAVVGAYGDNMDEGAEAIAASLKYSSSELEQLKQLGICLNYNGYGFTIDDLTFHPAELFERLHPYVNPLEFIQQDSAYKILLEAYLQDLDRAAATKASEEGSGAAIYMLPNEAWARRVSGVFGNQLARQNPQRAHAILTVMDDNCYRVSVRAPLSNRSGADDLCRQFETGGGRAAAAGINQLSKSDYPRFIARIMAQYP